MSDVSRFALTLIAVAGTFWIIKSSWQGSLKWVSQQGTNFNMSNSRQQMWRGIASVLGPIGAALFYLFNPNLNTKHATPNFSDDDTPTGGFEEKTQAAEQTLPPNTEMCLMVTESRNGKGPKVGSRYELLDGVHSIGRAPISEPQVKAITLQGDKAVSANHIYLSVQDDGSFAVTDRQSAYGTRINGHKLSANEPFPLKLGDSLKLGNTTLTLCRLDEKPVIKKAKVIKKQYRFRVTQGADKGKVLNLDKDRCLIGRAKESHLRLNDKKASRQHAEVRREGEQFIITDLGSTHGMFVNDLSIASRSLTVGDTVKLGDTILTFEEI